MRVIQVRISIDVREHEHVHMVGSVHTYLNIWIYTRVYALRAFIGIHGCVHVCA